MRRCLLTWLLLLGAFASPSQSPFSRIYQAVNTHYRNYPPETVYLQTDRHAYEQGSHVWYKAYLRLLGDTSPISRLLYVELADPSGLIIVRETLPVQGGAAVGEISIPNPATPGYYRLRAYTAWMMNFGANTYFDQTLYVGQTPLAPAALAATDTDAVQLEFFPEGGNLVQGLTSTVAFRASRSDRTGVEVTGKIVDSSGKTLTQIHCLHDGLGSFVLHPMARNYYRAIVDLPGGITQSFPLPAASQSGIVLFTRYVLGQSGQDSVYFRISRSIVNKNAYQHLLLCAQMDGICSFTYINFDTVTAGNYNNTVQSASTPLGLQDFPSPGVLQLTVFDDAGLPLAERLVFLHRLDKQRIAQLSPVQLDFSTHAKNSFTLEVPGDDHGRYAISVTRAKPSEAIDSVSDIRSYFLLQTSIKTPVADLRWYLKDSSARTLAGLDLLLLSATWSKFNWSKILHGEFPSLRYYAEPSLMLRGQAFWITTKSKVPMRGGEFSLILKSTKDGLLEMVKVPVDSLGRFTLTDLNFHDTISCYVQQSKSRNAKIVAVEWERSPLDSVRFIFPRAPSGGSPGLTDQKGLARPALPDSTSGEAPGAHPQKQGDTTILKTVDVKAYRKARADSLLAIYATGIFARPDAFLQVLDFTEDQSNKYLYSTSVLQYLESNVPGPVYKDDGSDEALIYWRMTADLFIPVSEADRIKANAPAFFLDEQRLNEGIEGYDEAIATLRDVKMEQVALIRVFQPGTMPLVSGNAPHGAIAIYRKNGKEGSLAPRAHPLDQINRVGYSTVGRFQAPDYAPGQFSTAADDRTTLYWNPNLVTDSATHRVNFSFFNPDKPSEALRIKIEGIDAQGRLITLETLFKK
jgi:hypothetical protein